MIRLKLDELIGGRFVRPGLSTCGYPVNSARHGEVPRLYSNICCSLRLRLRENFDRFTHDNFKEKEMADFRKIFFVLAGLLLVISSASAQSNLACTAFVANQPIMRQEGATEPAGDII